MTIGLAIVALGAVVGLVTFVLPMIAKAFTRANRVIHFAVEEHDYAARYHHRREDENE